MTDKWNDGKKCEDACRFAPPQNKWPCVDCDMRWHDRAESNYTILPCNSIEADSNTTSCESYYPTTDNAGTEIVVKDKAGVPLGTVNVETGVLTIKLPSITDEYSLKPIQTLGGCINASSDQCSRHFS